jgi:hypothetical protein
LFEKKIFYLIIAGDECSITYKEFNSVLVWEELPYRCFYGDFVLQGAKLMFSYFCAEATLADFANLKSGLLCLLQKLFDHSFTSKNM